MATAVPTTDAVKRRSEKEAVYVDKQSPYSNEGHVQPQPCAEPRLTSTGSQALDGDKTQVWVPATSINRSSQLGVTLLLLFGRPVGCISTSTTASIRDQMLLSNSSGSSQPLDILAPALMAAARSRSDAQYHRTLKEPLSKVNNIAVMTGSFW
jgi:hypothetical protein